MARAGREGDPEQSSQPLPLSQVWFQNRRSKERRMKQLSALGARRHAFFRSPRRMRPLGGRLDESEMLGSTPYTYYGGKQPPRTRCPTPRSMLLEGAGPDSRDLRLRLDPSLPSTAPTQVHSPADTSWTENQTHGFTQPCSGTNR